MNTRKSLVRNIAELPWQQLPGHFDGALSKLLVHPETADARLIDHRISTYAPMGYVAPHTHTVQEQIYHVLEGEGLMEIDGVRQVIRRHDVVFIPPGIEHALYNSGLVQLTFLVITTPVSDTEPAPT
jgi:quercetin dioxygenase-like cupin family protein